MNNSNVSCNLTPLCIVFGAIAYLVTHSIPWALIIGFGWWIPVVLIFLLLYLVGEAVDAFDRRQQRKRAARLAAARRAEVQVNRKGK
jgi:hypothetical protein